MSLKPPTRPYPVPLLKLNYQNWVYKSNLNCRITRGMTSEEFDHTQGKTAVQLGRDALWYSVHTLLPVLILAVVVFAISLTRPDIDQNNPKLLGTALALLVPMIGGFAIAKGQQNPIAGYVWISGILFFTLVCVWVLDLPTGNGLCENCFALEKLRRTFFDIDHGSGLLGGDGLLIGTWIPLSMIGYAIGARFGLDR